jgi:Fur family transcriptional regulator, ferric uptake regulator
MTSVESVLQLLRSHGLRMTPQRRAIVAEIMAAKGHISPVAISRAVQERVPGVNASTIYRTLDVLEELGVVSHAHLESGPEYHRQSESRHIHLTCSSCGAEDSLSLDEAESLERLILRHHGFSPDLSHFAISGRCANCRAKDRSGATGGGAA